MLTRRKLLSLLPAAGCAPLYAFGVEPEWLQRTVTQVKLPCRNLNRTVRILHLSDFHASAVVPFSLIENSITLGLETKPDVICLTGDFVTDATPIDEAAYARILRRISGAAPTFAALGNHDGGAWAASVGGLKDTTMVQALLRAGHVSLLHNRSEMVRIGDQSIRFVGVADLWSNEVDGDSAFTGVSADDPAILLAHNPDTKDALADRPWDLMLSGHTHGGQVVLPFLGAHFVPVRDKRFIAGLKEWNGRQVYITRGVGNVRGVRINCRPEVTILDLTA
ncbi:MAG TPA: phosphodiesterase YaeI [Bryobacteraceae bacterium]|nr:phosphodiesterase YaeI [Bryobacteraceae bacterium]